MKPYDEIEDMLFQSSKSRISHFSCNHVIPDQNLVCLALKSGPSSTLFDFTYKNRSSSNLVSKSDLVNAVVIEQQGLTRVSINYSC
jgi:chromosome transmission fidelity protein 1